MEKDSRIVVGCCVAMFAALFVVGVVSNIVVRHLVQTSTLWIAIVLGIRNSKLTKWAAYALLRFLVGVDGRNLVLLARLDSLPFWNILPG